MRSTTLTFTASQHEGETPSCHATTRTLATSFSSFDVCPTYTFSGAPLLARPLQRGVRRRKEMLQSGSRSGRERRVMPAHRSELLQGPKMASPEHDGNREGDQESDTEHGRTGEIERRRNNQYAE